MDDSELPPVRISRCGCMIAADARPAGHAFETTSFRDVRVPVYCCVEHDKTRDELGGRQELEKENQTAGLIGADGQEDRGLWRAQSVVPLPRGYPHLQFWPP